MSGGDGGGRADRDRHRTATLPAAAVGSRMRFVARFLGRTLEYTYEVREVEPGRRFVMSTAQGPFRCGARTKPIYGA